jgi:hypothetical protein
MLKIKSGNQRVWRADTYCMYFLSHVENYNLIVMLPEPRDKLVRFLVLRQDDNDDDDGAEALVGSGSTEDLLVAMKAAVQMAVRLTGKERSSNPDREQPLPVKWSRTENLLGQPIKTSVQSY